MTDPEVSSVVFDSFPHKMRQEEKHLCKATEKGEENIGIILLGVLQSVQVQAGRAQGDAQKSNGQERKGEGGM